jgi:Pentatricopeptide repeat domain
VNLTAATTIAFAARLHSKRPLLMIRTVIRWHRCHKGSVGTAVSVKSLSKRVHLWKAHVINYHCFQSVSFLSSSYLNEEAPTEDQYRALHRDQHGSRADEMKSRDEGPYPVGEMKLEQFLQLEGEVREFVSDNARMTRQGIEHSLRLLCRLIREHEANPSLLDEYEMTHWIIGKYPRCTRLLDEVLTKWAMWWSENGIEHEDLSPKAMYELVDNFSSGTPPLQLTAKTLGILISVAANNCEQNSAPIFAEMLLDRMLEESTLNPQMRPSNLVFKAVITAWSKSGLPEAYARVEALHSTMCSMFNDGVIEHPPDNATYLARMQTVVKCDKRDAPWRLSEILDEMKNSPFHSVTPCTAAYRMVIHSWIHSNENQSMQKAYALFKEIFLLYLSTRDERVLVDVDIFSMMISTLAKKEEYGKAEEIFVMLKKLHRSTGDHRFKPNAAVLQGMIIGYSKSRKPGALEKADSMLMHLEDLAAKDEAKIPKHGYYNDVAEAYADRRTVDGLERAEQLLEKMVKYHLAGVPRMAPKKSLYDQLIRNWSRSPHKDAALRAERILNTMHDVAKTQHIHRIAPDEQSYCLAMMAWSRSTDNAAPDRAEMLLLKMLDQFNRGDLTMKPSILHYTTLLSTFARCKLPDGPARAQTIFDDAIERYEATGDSSMQPDSFFYTSMMSVLANAGNSTAAENLFLKMYEAYVDRKQKNMMPTTRSFNVLLEACIKSGTPDAHKKAKYVFDSMIGFTEEGVLNVPPDGQTYNLMIDMMAKSEQEDSAEQAEKYLDMMKTAPLLQEQRGDVLIFSAYVAAINAWCWSNHVHAMTRVEALIDELVGLTKSGNIPRPTSINYDRFLRLLASSKVPERLVAKVRALQVGGGRKANLQLKVKR